MVKSKEEIKLAIPARRPNVPPVGSHWGFTLKGTKHWEEIYFIFFIKTSVHLDRKARASQAASGRFTVVETQPLTVHYCTIVSQISYEKDSINSTVIEIKKCTFWFLNIMWLTHLIQKKQCQQLHLLLIIIFTLCPILLYAPFIAKLTTLQIVVPPPGEYIRIHCWGLLSLRRHVEKVERLSEHLNTD